MDIMNTTSTFEELKSWSMLSPRPIVSGDVCYWLGIVMHRKMAFNIAMVMHMKIPVTPRQKEILWNDQYELFLELKKSGIDIDLTSYTYDGLFKYLYQEIHTKVNRNNYLQDWKDDPRLVLNYFLKEIA